MLFRMTLFVFFHDDMNHVGALLGHVHVAVVSVRMFAMLVHVLRHDFSRVVRVVGDLAHCIDGMAVGDSVNRACEQRHDEHRHGACGDHD